MSAKPQMGLVGVDELVPALEKTDRACRLLLRQLRESRPAVLEEPEFDEPVKLARRQLRENRALLGTEPSGAKLDETSGPSTERRWRLRSW